jgi:cell division protein FtsB
MGYNICDHDYGVRLGGARPRIVTLCGSTRFKLEFEITAAELTMTGAIVLKPDVFMNDGHAAKAHLPAVTEAEKAALDELHKRKIDLADEIFVINAENYIGESTRSEIAYAEARGKKIRYLVQ